MASLLLSVACAAPAARTPHVPLSSYLRGATAAQTSCPLAEVEISDHGWTLGNETWLATCGATRFRCTHVATGYGTGLTCIKVRSEPPAAASPPPAETAIAAASAPRPPAVDPPGAAELRALLDQERDAILACGGWRLVGLKAQVGQTLEVQLTGDLAGSPQEACVRQLLARIHPSPTQIPPGTAVVHVVR